MRQVSINLFVSAAALLIVAIALEVSFRFAPSLLPHGSYGSGRYDPELRTIVHGSTATYNKVRYVVREPNQEGFLDVEHAPKRASANQIRIGFFGDSYVESLQVPFDQVFHQLLSKQFQEFSIESLGFGISGWGTLHSYLAYQAKADRYDMDIVIYVFVENDLGDNLYSIQRSTPELTPKAYAELSEDGPGFSLRWANPPDEVSAAYRIGKAVLNRSLLARVIRNRLALLRRGGVAVELDAADREMARPAKSDGVPGQGDLPSTWPLRYREEAEELGQRILKQFRDATVSRGHTFLILYVPRSDSHLKGEIPVEDTWLPWLHRTCHTLGVPLLDPTEALRARRIDGQLMYDDHWTPAGHEVIASELARQLKPYVERLVLTSQESH